MTARACPESEQMAYQLKLKVSEPQADELKSAVRPSRLNALINQIISGRIDTARCPETEQKDLSTESEQRT